MDEMNIFNDIKFEINELYLRIINSNKRRENMNQYKQMMNFFKIYIDGVIKIINNFIEYLLGKDNIEKNILYDLNII